MQQESLHESLNVPLGGGWQFAGALSIVGATLTMLLSAHDFHSWGIGAMTALYTPIMTFAFYRIWGIYLQLRTKHTQADVKEFNRRAKSFAVVNQVVMLGFLAALIWVPR